MHLKGLESIFSISLNGIPSKNNSQSQTSFPHWLTFSSKDDKHDPTHTRMSSDAIYDDLSQ